MIQTSECAQARVKSLKAEGGGGGEKKKKKELKIFSRFKNKNL
jgi:hypothetical protein